MFVSLGLASLRGAGDTSPLGPLRALGSSLRELFREDLIWSLAFVIATAGCGLIANALVFRSLAHRAART
jgi:hypothetical protein